MYRKKICSYVLLLTSLVALLLNMNGYSLVANAQVTPAVSISPQLTVALINETFSVNVSVSQVTNLCSWQVFIYFRNDILEAESFAEGPFLNSFGPTDFDGNFNNSYNATDGELWMYCIRMWSGYGVNGSGTLATVTFQAIQGGISPLTLEYVILGNSTAQPMSYTITDGTVAVKQHQVGITSVDPFHRALGRGYSMKTNVTVENQGNYTETFNVTAYANNTVIQTQTITLPNSSSTTITFTWNTTSFAMGNYTISANVTLALGETNNWTGPSTYGTVQITKVGDFGGYPPGSVVPQFGYFTGSCGPQDIPLFIQCYRGTAGQWEYLGDLGGYPPGSDVPQFFLSTGSCGPVDIPLFIRCYRGQGPTYP